MPFRRAGPLVPDGAAAPVELLLPFGVILAPHVSGVRGELPCPNGPSELRSLFWQFCFPARRSAGAVATEAVMAAATVAAMGAISAGGTVVVMAAIFAVATASATRILAAGTTVVEGSRDPIRSGTEVSPAITPLPGM